jgi:hypothetical protein
MHLSRIGKSPKTAGSTIRGMEIDASSFTTINLCAVIINHQAGSVLDNGGSLEGINH